MDESINEGGRKGRHGDVVLGLTQQAMREGNSGAKRKKA